MEYRISNQTKLNLEKRATRILDKYIGEIAGEADRARAEGHDPIAADGLLDDACIDRLTGADRGSWYENKQDAIKSTLDLMTSAAWPEFIEWAEQVMDTDVLYGEVLSDPNKLDIHVRVWVADRYCDDILATIGK